MAVPMRISDQKSAGRWIWAAVVFFLAVCPSAKGEVKFPEVIQKADYTFKLQGTGYKRFLFMRAFDAGFYATEDTRMKNILSDVPKHLEVEYHVGIPAKSLTDYTITHMKLNITKEEFFELKEQVALMGQYFVDLKANDRFSLTYLPGVGTEFAHNGKLTGVIAGEPFGRALFSVWIGEKPFDQNLKRKVLGMK